MKKLLVLFALLSLNGCAVYDAYFMAKYDTNENALVSKIRTMAELGVDDCKNQLKSEVTFNDLYYYSVELRNFTQYIPRNDDTLKLEIDVSALTAPFGPVSNIVPAGTGLPYLLSTKVLFIDNGLS